MQPKETKRYDHIDLLKFISMLMVVSLHTSLWNNNFMVNNNLNVFIQFIVRLICEGVPIFVLINGYLLINKDVNLKKHIKKMCKIILIIVLWSSLSFTLICLVKKDSLSFKKIIDNVLLLDVNEPNCGHLWFLQHLFKLYLIYPILNFLFKENKKVYYYFFYIVLFFVFFPKLLISINNVMHSVYIGNFYTFIDRINPFRSGIFIFYFMLGGILREKEDILKNNVKIILLGILSYIISVVYCYHIIKFENHPFVSNYIYGSILLAAIITALFSLTLKYKSKNRIYNKYITSIGKNTMGIYLIHFPLNIIIRNLFTINLVNLPQRTIYFLIILNLSWIISLIIAKIPYINKSIKL